MLVTSDGSRTSVLRTSRLLHHSDGKNPLYWSQLLLLLITSKAFALLPTAENDPSFHCTIIWLEKLTLKFPHVIFNPLFIPLFCDYSTWGNCVSQKSRVCGAERCLSLEAGLEAEVVVPGSSPCLLHECPPNKSHLSRLLKPFRAWLAVTVSTKSENRLWVLSPGWAI